MLRDIALVFISPLNQAILILAIGLLLAYLRPQRKKTYKACFIAAGAWLYLCSQYFFSFMLIAPLENFAPPMQLENMQEHKSSAIFVLACYFYDAPDKPMVSQWNDCSLRRLVQASLMYKNQPQTIILTGGDFNQYSDAVYADAAKTFLIALGVPESDIVAIYADTGTKPEIFALKQGEFAYEHYYVVSSATHSYRLSKLMQQVNINRYTLFPVDHYNINEFNFEPALPEILHLKRSEAAFYEYAAIVNMWLEGEPN
ncbi:YdcF family protein [Glaciecola sp. SC05]|uniref:YdcF family protein n=1 Tax=Glaciecola sp. SC05 TaxID=1987355 RepID=UPI0035299E19